MGPQIEKRLAEAFGPIARGPGLRSDGTTRHEALDVQVPANEGNMQRSFQQYQLMWPLQPQLSIGDHNIRELAVVTGYSSKLLA